MCHFCPVSVASMTLWRWCSVCWMLEPVWTPATVSCGRLCMLLPPVGTLAWCSSSFKREFDTLSFETGSTAHYQYKYSSTLKALCKCVNIPEWLYTRVCPWATWFFFHIGVYCCYIYVCVLLVGRTCWLLMRTATCHMTCVKMRPLLSCWRLLWLNRVSILDSSQKIPRNSK